MQEGERACPTYYRFLFALGTEIEAGKLDDYIGRLNRLGIPEERIHDLIPLSPLCPELMRSDAESVREDFPHAAWLQQSLVILAHQCLLLEEEALPLLAETLLQNAR